jgi:hypothetical protein
MGVHGFIQGILADEYRSIAAYPSFKSFQQQARHRPRALVRTA